MIGAMCSAMNIIAVQLMSVDKDIGAYCRLATLPSEEELYLEGMIAVKSVSLIIMYIVLCSFLIITNGSMAVMLRRQQRNTAANLTRNYLTKATQKKNKKNIYFILITSACMMFCLPQPILDLVMAVDIHNNMQAAYENYISVFLNTLLISCTTLAFFLNTFVAVQF